MKPKRIAALAMLVAAASIGLAGPAGADFDDGAYTMTMTESDKFVLGTRTWEVSSCGPDCRHVQVVDGTAYDFHQADNSWTAMAPPTFSAHGYTTTFDSDSLYGTFTFDDGAYYKYQLKKN